MNDVDDEVATGEEPEDKDDKAFDQVSSQLQAIREQMYRIRTKLLEQIDRVQSLLNNPLCNDDSPSIDKGHRTFSIA